MSKTPAISWCRGRDSNPHVPFETQDFKSYLGFFRNPKKHPKTQYSRLFPAFFHLSRFTRFWPIARRSVSRVSAKDQGCGHEC